MPASDIFANARRLLQASGERRTHGNLQKYATRNPLQRWLMTRYLKAAADLVRLSGCKTVLDAGGGEGFLSRYLQMETGVQPTVIDRDEEALVRGRILYPSVRFIHGDITSMDLPKGSFDLVICMQVLEHLKDPAAAVGRLAKISSGYCLFAVPHEPLFMLMNMLRLKNVSRFGNDPEHVNHWTPSSFRHFLQAASSECVGWRACPPWMMGLFRCGDR
jgi:2-polyprenyl-3-methyl-5-hydroxy-6-metoxy-1,4-benzoquinol methylase